MRKAVLYSLLVLGIIIGSPLLLIFYSNVSYDLAKNKCREFFSFVNSVPEYPNNQGWKVVEGLSLDRKACVPELYFTGPSAKEEVFTYYTDYYLKKGWEITNESNFSDFSGNPQNDKYLVLENDSYTIQLSSHSREHLDYNYSFSFSQKNTNSQN